MAVNDISLLFPDEKFADAKKLLVTIKPWWKRYLDRFEPVPISVPRHDDEQQWRARVSIAEKSLTMYVDVNFAMESSLSELAGAIEHELQRSRRRFDEREEGVPEPARGEYWRIATRMEVADALSREYEHSSLSHHDLFHKLLSTSATFGPSLIEKYNVTELPVSDMTWMPEMLDLESDCSAEDYAIEMARRDGRMNDNDHSDPSDDNDDSDDANGGDGSGSGEESGSSESSNDNGESIDDDATDSSADSDSSDSADEHSDTGESASESDDASSESNNGSNDATDGDESAENESKSDSGNAGSAESTDDVDENSPSDFKSSSGSGEGGSESSSAEQQSEPADQPDGHDMDNAEDSGSSERSGDEQQENGESATGDNAGDDYEQMHTDNGQGQGRQGGWQGKDASGDEREHVDSDVLANEDGSATSVGIEESNQIASADGQTDRASSSTQGNISDSPHEAGIAEQIKQMKQEFPSLEWDAEKSRPEIYNPYYSDDVDDLEAIEQQLEQREREQADEELIEDVKTASLASDFDPAAPLSPSFDDIDIADEELHRRNIHWTDYMVEIVSNTVDQQVLKGSDDYSYQHRNPNQSLTGPILMGGISYSPTIYAVFDTSGSMLRYLNAEKELLADLFQSIHENYQARVNWFSANANIYHAGESTDFDFDVAQAFSFAGGGTNFCTDLNRLVAGDFSLHGELYDEPDVIVLFSDMEFPWSGELAEGEPDVPIIRVMPAQSVLAKTKKRNMKMFNAPAWLYEPDSLVEMV